MSRLRRHPENHLVERIGWLRAAVLGANDGIVSTASLIVGVAAAAATRNDVLIAGVAGLVSSREVWRQTGQQREFCASTDLRQCGGFHAKPVVIGDFSAAKSSGECWSRKDWRTETN
jgi:hypothetical protein